MYNEINPKCNALSNPNNEPILDGDIKRILRICNSGDIADVKELMLFVPERKLDGHVPPHAAPLYEDEDFAAEAAKYINDQSKNFEGMVYHIQIKGFVCKIFDALQVVKS